METKDFIGIICIVGAWMLGAFIGLDAGETSMQAKAIEHGYAGYDRTTGEFMWHEDKIK